MNAVIDEKVNLEEQLKLKFDDYDQMKNQIVKTEKEKESMKA